MGLFEKIFGTYSDRAIKQIMPLVEEINKLEPDMKAKSDSELKSMTDIFKKRIADGENLDSILPEAFAVVREAACVSSDKDIMMYSSSAGLYCIKAELPR